MGAHSRERRCMMKLKTLAIFAVILVVFCILYQVAKKSRLFTGRGRRANTYKLLSRRVPESSFLGEAESFNLDKLRGTKQAKKPQELPDFVKQQIPKQSSRPQTGTKGSLSWESVKFWKPHDVIGRPHDDPLLLAYIRTQIHAIPTLIMPYNLTRGEMKDFSKKNQTTQVKKLFREKANGIFVEVEVNDGEANSNTLYWEREYGWTGVLMEPEPVNFKKLLSKHRKAFLLHASLCPTNVANTTKFQDDLSQQYSSTEVPCYPFYSVMAALDFPPIDFYSLHVQGLELEILKTIPFNLFNIRVLMVDFSRIPEGFDGLRNFMEEQGYELKNILQSDAIFVKNGVNLLA